MICKNSKIIWAAQQFFLVTHKHLCELTGMHPNSLWRSLPRLVESGQLYCKELGMYRPHVYATHDIRKRKRSNFAHDFMITDIHLALHRTGKLLEWLQPRQKFKGAVNEDALFRVPVLTESGQEKKLTYFLEADTGSEPDWQIQEKIKRYLNTKGHVLFVVRVQDEDTSQQSKAETDRRIQSLIRQAEKFLPSEQSQDFTWKKFLFVSLDTLMRDPLGPVLEIAYDRKNKYTLIPSFRQGC